MYPVLVLALALINLQCAACANPTTASLTPTHEIQESVPIVEVHFANETNQDPNRLNGRAHEHHGSRALAEPVNNPALAKRQQEREAAIEEMNQFRLEYNKFKILQQLGIRTDPTKLKSLPPIADDVRDKIINRRALNEPPISYERGIKHKRSLRCDEVKEGEDTCCLQNFYVNFTAIGWDKWILSPAGYQANYCRGPCDLSHARYFHSTVLSQFNDLRLCCSPREVSPIKVLFAEDGDTIQEQWLPEMVVNSCDCA